MTQLLREPLVHFIAAGAATFWASHFADVTESSDATRITISSNDIRILSSNYSSKYGTPPTPQQLETLVDTFVKEEIFYREAIKLGLEIDDEIIRRRLVQKYEFLQQDLQIPSEPSDSDLMQYYKAHLARYQQPAKLTFTHIYFSADERGLDGAHDAAANAASRLNRENPRHDLDYGDRFPGPRDFYSVSNAEIARVFGQGGISDEAFQVESRHWSAPLRSAFGWHTVYVHSQQPPQVPPFSDVRAEVRSDFLEADSERRKSALLQNLKHNFQILRE